MGEPMDPSTLDTAPEAATAPPPPAPRPLILSRAAAFEVRLREAHPRPWATLLLVGLTAGTYLLQSVAGGRWLDADADLLVTCGAGYGPRLIGQGSGGGR